MNSLLLVAVTVLERVGFSDCHLACGTYHGMPS